MTAPARSLDQLSPTRISPADERVLAWLERFDVELREAGLTENSAAGYEALAENNHRSRGLGSLSDPDARLRWSGVLAMLLLLLVFGWCVWHFALTGRVLLTAGRWSLAVHPYASMLG